MLPLVDGALPRLCKPEGANKVFISYQFWVECFFLSWAGLMEDGVGKEHVGDVKYFEHAGLKAKQTSPNCHPRWCRLQFDTLVSICFRLTFFRLLLTHLRWEIVKLNIGELFDYSSHAPFFILFEN